MLVWGVSGAETYGEEKVGNVVRNVHGDPHVGEVEAVA